MGSVGRVGIAIVFWIRKKTITELTFCDFFSNRLHHRLAHGFWIPIIEGNLSVVINHKVVGDRSLLLRVIVREDDDNEAALQVEFFDHEGLVAGCNLCVGEVDLQRS